MGVLIFLAIVGVGYCSAFVDTVVSNTNENRHWVWLGS